MSNRLRAMQGAVGLLYLGPLLAGLGGFDWVIVPVFTLIFLLWLLAMRPDEWPRSPAEWQSPDAWIALLMRVVVQFALVALCFAIGRGLGGVVAADLPMPAMLPIGLSLVAVPLARLFCPPGQMAEMTLFLHDAADQVEATATPDADAAARAARRLLAERLTQPLADLGAATRQDTIAAHRHALEAHLPAEDLYEALQARLAGADRASVLRRAFILHATSPLTVEACPGRATPVKALQAAGADPDLLILFARRCIELLEHHADAWGECPNEQALEAARLGTPPEVDELLSRLIAQSRALAPLAADGR